MSSILRFVRWLFKLTVFFTLFAFALNNQQDCALHFFFGHQWNAPQVLIVLVVFGLGVAVGVLGMLPWWWKHRRRKIPAPPPPVEVNSSQWQ